jgi:hypothetical protein
MQHDLPPAFGRPRLGEPRPYSVERLAALVLAVPGALLVVAVLALALTGHVGAGTAAGAIAAGGVQLALAAALWQHLRGARVLALTLSLGWAAVLVAVGDDRVTPPLLLPAVVAVGLLLPLPARTAQRIRDAVARERAHAPAGTGGSLQAWSLPAAALLVIGEGVWLAVSTVGGLIRSATTPGLGALLDTAGRFILAIVEVPLELVVFPAAGLLLLTGSLAARWLVLLLEALVLLGALSGRLETTRSQVSAGLAVVVVALLLLHRRAPPQR